MTGFNGSCFNRTRFNGPAPGGVLTLTGTAADQLHLGDHASASVLGFGVVASFAGEQGGYLGAVMQGRRVPLLVRTLGAGSVPRVPLLPPVATLVDEGGSVVLQAELPAMNQGGTVGLFGMGLRLGGNMPPGRYCVVYSYVLGTVVQMLHSFFDVVAGDPAGAVISTFAHDRPEARYVLAQLDGGQLVQGRNPKF